MLMLACATGFRVSPSLLPALAFTWAELFVLETCQSLFYGLAVYWCVVPHRMASIW